MVPDADDNPDFSSGPEVIVSEYEEWRMTWQRSKSLSMSDL